MNGPTIKHSYTIPCATAFRDAVEHLAARRKVNVGDLARSVLLVVPPEVISASPDPGEPAGEDRETVVLKSGPSKGRPWRRKPRLQVRMPPGYPVTFVRKALGIALAAEKGDVAVQLVDPRQPGHTALEKAEAKDELERMRAIISVLAFEPLPNGVRTREEALHILGFPPAAAPDQKTVRAKFRMLATIHHPDSTYGNHQRMSQLNAAIDVLRRG